MHSPAYVYLAFTEKLLTKVKERPLILITDGHSTRDTATLQCALDDVHVFQLHSHSTHITQPLDIGVYPVFKRFWNEEFDKYCMEQKDCKNGVDRATVTKLIAGIMTNVDSSNVVKHRSI